MTAIAADAERGPGGWLTLRYRITARPGRLVVPPPAAPQRTDELWRHTCFEAFVRPAEGERYYEFNLAPSGEWAAYSFDGYRDRMAPLEGVAEPQIGWTVVEDGFELWTELELPQAAFAPWTVGLSAVIEEAGGRTSYWALAHPPGEADFHHSDGFALDLPAS
ncbi:MAG: DOMON-like domain-containing protein [Phenylobacterium sp.]|nr:MAG: DOMON-like domain-containing protein [Phenylobacterium sp.]